MGKKKWTVPSHVGYGMVDYDSNDSGCRGVCNDSYCRCSTVSPVITNVYHSDIYAQVTSNTKINSIKEYCLDRGIRRSFTVESFDAYGVGGYYGEETKVTMEPSARLRLESLISFIEKSSEGECIEHVLELEYGHVLPSLKSRKDWRIEKVKVSDIHNENYKHVNPKTVEEYENDIELNSVSDPMVLCIKHTNHEFRLIDGYHRYSAAQKKNIKTINVICTDKD